MTSTACDECSPGNSSGGIQFSGTERRGGAPVGRTAADVPLSALKNLKDARCAHVYACEVLMFAAGNSAYETNLRCGLIMVF